MADTSPAGRIRGSSHDAADPNTPDHLIDPRLTWVLRWLGAEFGPLGVAVVAARMTDRDALIARLYLPADYEPKPSPEEPQPEQDPTYEGGGSDRYQLSERAVEQVAYSSVRNRPQPYLKLDPETQTLDLWDAKTADWKGPC